MEDEDWDELATMLLDGPGRCGACGHDPACGFASIYVGDGQIWLCHDDDHTCYAAS